LFVDILTDTGRAADWTDGRANHVAHGEHGFIKLKKTRDMTVSANKIASLQGAAK